MAGEAAATLLGIQTIQSVLQLFELNLAFAASKCPFDASVDVLTSMDFDYIIVGGGAAGSVLANRLTANPDVNVLMLEAGGCPPLEGVLLGAFPYAAQGVNDYNYKTVQNNYTFQNIQDNVGHLTMGKMLGGTIGHSHGHHFVPHESTYEMWANATNDSSWTFEEILPYIRKFENVVDEDIIEQYGYYHGTDGPIEIRRQRDEESQRLLDVYADIGYKVVIDTNNNSDPFVVFEPMLQNGNTYKQGGAISFLDPVQKRHNLYVLTNATVSKILFDSNNVATGVQFSYSESSYVVNCTKEIILSAGAIKTPQLLMLSGIGPSEHLTSKNIPVIADLPVGKNFRDLQSFNMLYTLEENSVPAPSLDYTKYPGHVALNLANLDNTTTGPLCQGLNLFFDQGSAGLLGLCLNVFSYKPSLCQKWNDATVGKNVLYTFVTLLQTVSTGYLELNTTDINDQPLIYDGYLSDNTDLVNLARCAANNAKVLNSTDYKNVGAQFVDFDFCSEYEMFSDEYWQCQALAMLTPTWQYHGTAAMGSVIDSKLQVKGVTGLRVVDASAIPEIHNSDIVFAVYVVAEKAADLIISSYENY